jgi:hypothetical protein
MTKRASKKSANRRSRSDPISEQVDVAGIRPATFKLVEKAEGSYDLFRSGRKIGTARTEEGGEVSGRFTAADGEWSATSRTARELLQVIGRYLLTVDARSARSADNRPPSKAKPTAEERLSIAFLKKAQTNRLSALDQVLAAMRKDMRRLDR